MPVLSCVDSVQSDEVRGAKFLVLGSLLNVRAVNMEAERQLLLSHAYRSEMVVSLLSVFLLQNGFLMLRRVRVQV